jgi:hypothetical protein
MKNILRLIICCSSSSEIPFDTVGVENSTVTGENSDNVFYIEGYSAQLHLIVP